MVDIQRMNVKILECEVERIEAMRAFVRVVLVGALGACVVLAASPWWAQAFAAGVSTVTATAVVASAADAIVSSDPLSHLSQIDPFGGLAYQDDALARSAQVFAVSDPARSQRYITEATAISDYFVQNDALESDGKIGWGLPVAWDAFGDGTINPANQIYGFQTALVSWALLDTYTVTQNSAYLTAVESAMANYAPSGTTSFGQICQSCFMFWYSTNPNDVGRYVKNTNVLLGQVEAELFRVTGDSQYQAVASAIYNEETYEIVQHGNYRYLGVDDPKFNPATSPDAHIALETFAYSQIASALGLNDSQTQATFDGMVKAFWVCGSACLAAPITSAPGLATSIYAQFMACYPVAFDTTYASVCQQMFTNPNQMNLLPFPLIGLLYALPLLPSVTSTPAPATRVPHRLRPPSPGPRGPGGPAPFALG